MGGCGGLQGIHLVHQVVDLGGVLYVDLVDLVGQCQQIAVGLGQGFVGLVGLFLNGLHSRIHFVNFGGQVGGEGFQGGDIFLGFGHIALQGGHLVHQVIDLGGVLYVDLVDLIGQCQQIAVGLGQGFVGLIGLFFQGGHGFVGLVGLLLNGLHGFVGFIGLILQGGNFFVGRFLISGQVFHGGIRFFLGVVIGQLFIHAFGGGIFFIQQGFQGGVFRFQRIHAFLQFLHIVPVGHGGLLDDLQGGFHHHVFLAVHMDGGLDGVFAAEDVFVGGLIGDGGAFGQVGHQQVLFRAVKVVTGIFEYGAIFFGQGAGGQNAQCQRQAQKKQTMGALHGNPPLLMNDYIYRTLKNEALSRINGTIFVFFVIYLPLYIQKRPAGWAERRMGISTG